MKNPLLKGSRAALRVIRGGVWIDYPYYLRSAWRHVNTPTASNIIIGFRLFRTQEKS